MRTGPLSTFSIEPSAAPISALLTKLAHTPLNTSPTVPQSAYVKKGAFKL